MATEYLKDKHKLVGIRYMLLYIAGINAIISFVLHMASSFFDTFIPIYLQALIIGVFAYILPIVIYAKTNHITAQSAADKFYLKGCKVPLLILAAIMGCCFQFVVVLIDLPVNMISGNSSSYIPSTPAELIAAVFVIAVMPAIFEEFLFRGIVLGSMSEFNTKAAMVFSAIMFAVMHADIYGLIGYIIMGLILVSIVRRTNSIYSAMVFHFANNTTALILGYINDELIYMPVFTISLFAIGVILFITAYMLFASITKKPKEICLMKTGGLLGQSFINLPIIMCIAVIVITEIMISLI